jgi:hypothetical protein
MIVPTELAKEPQIDAAVTEVVSQLSPSVRRIRYDIEQDWTGQWAIFFRVLLSDDASKPGNLRQIVPRIIWTMSERLNLPDLGMFPYFNFRSETEQALLRDPAWT